MRTENIHYWGVKQHIYGDAGTFDIQTNPEWEALRRGKFTASTADEMLTAGKVEVVDQKTGKTVNKIDKSVLGKSAEGLCYSVITDRFTKFVRPADRGAWADKDSVARGLQLEPHARELYEKQTGFKVRECGFVEHWSGWFGFSPDGIVEEQNIGIEIKCPEPDNAQKMINEVGSAAHLKQMAFAMWCDDLDCYDYVIYSPELCQSEQLGLDDQVFIFSFSREDLQEYIDEIDRRAPVLLEFVNRAAMGYKKIGKKRQFIHKRS